MDSTGTAALFDALRRAGLYAPHVLARLPEPPPANPVALSDSLAELGVLTGYQARKLRLNRFSDVVIGQYLVLDKVGEGGMGKVYKAVQLRTGRTVALKVVRGQLLSNPVIMRRYQREAAAAASLSHPNIVGLYDADEADGKHFMAMEFVDGSDLSRLVKTFGPLEFAEGCEYIRQAALGLQHAHDAGLVHRDIKPSNLLVCGERAIPGTGGVAVVKVLDMGLVRNILEDGNENSEVTRDGTVVGTPDYMAPEQAKNSSSVGPAADLYSLGCTLYFLFTGRPPFPTGTPIEKLLQHQIDKPTDPRKFRPDMPQGLHDLILKLLAKLPQDRLASAGLLAEKLIPFAAGETNDLGISDLRLPSRPAPAPMVFVPDGSTQIVTKPEAPAPVATLPAPKPVVVRKPKPSPPRPVLAVPTPRPESETAIVIPASEPDVEILDAEPVYRPRREKTASKPLPKGVIVAAAVVGVAIFGGILAAVLGGKGSAGSAAEPPPTNANKNSSPTPIKPTGPLAVEALLPDRAAAVVVAFPGQYFAEFKKDLRDESRLQKSLVRLDRDFVFPLEKLDRVVIGFPADLGVVAAGEGTPISSSTAEEQSRVPAAEKTKIGDVRLTAFPSAGWKSYTGGVAGARAAVVGSPAEAVANVVGRGAVKPAAGLTPAMLAAIAEANGMNKPFLSFAADSRYTLPGVGPLSDHGIKLATGRVRIVAHRLKAELQIQAATRDQLQDFLSQVLFSKLGEKHPGLKPFLDPLRDDSARSFEEGPGGVTVRMTAEWSIDDFHFWIEDLLPRL
jgi:eukaryotic-like serine/threonine-protein kinase